MAKRKIKIGGREVMAEDVQFESPEAEKWNKYLLHDGSEIKVKAVVANIFRVEGEYSPNGDPIYSVTASLIINTLSPDNLKRK